MNAGIAEVAQPAFNFIERNKLSINRMPRFSEGVFCSPDALDRIVGNNPTDGERVVSIEERGFLVCRREPVRPFGAK